MNRRAVLCAISELAAAAAIMACPATGPALAQSSGPPAATPAAPQPEIPSTDSGTSELTLAPRPVIALSGLASWEDGLKTIMGAHDRIREAMGKAGLQPGGRPLAVFTETDDKGFKFEAEIPLVAQPDTPPTLDADLHFTQSPGGHTMKFEHRGAYDDIDTTYEAITAYLDEKGLEAQNLFVEEYLTTPSGSDDETLEVDIYVFLR